MGVRSDSGNRLDHLGGVLDVAALGIQPGEIQHHFFGVRLDGLRGLELLFRLFGSVLHGVKLAEDHAVFHALGLERHDLFVFGDGLVEHVAVRRRRGDGILRFAQLAQIDAAQQAGGRRCRRERSSAVRAPWLRLV